MKCNFIFTPVDLNTVMFHFIEQLSQGIQNYLKSSLRLLLSLDYIIGVDFFVHTKKLIVQKQSLGIPFNSITLALSSFRFYFSFIIYLYMKGKGWG